MSMTPVLLTIQGQTMSVKAWSRVPGSVAYHTIITRLRSGWDHEEAVFAERGQIYFPIGELSQWGSVRSLNWRTA